MRGGSVDTPGQHLASQGLLGTGSVTVV